MSELDLRSLLDALVEKEIEFIVIGGVAVVAHGHLRTTEDLDVVPNSAAENLERLAKALVTLEATLPTAEGRVFEADRDGGALSRGSNVTADTKFGGLDVVQRAQGVPPYAVLAKDAIETDLLGVQVRVCSLARLREMKAAQGRAQDQADLENLPEL